MAKEYNDRHRVNMQDMHATLRRNELQRPPLLRQLLDARFERS
jgi:hypothetical protein